MCTSYWNALSGLSAYYYSAHCKSYLGVRVSKLWCLFILTDLKFEGVKYKYELKYISKYLTVHPE